MADSLLTPSSRPKRKSLLRPPNFLSRLPRKLTAIDLDGDLLRVVQTVRKNDSIQFTRFAVEHLDLPASTPPDPVAAGRAIAKTLARLKIKPGPVIMGLSRTQTILRPLSLPAPDNPAELASMVHFQVSKDLPFNLDEAVIDFKIQPERPSPANSPQSTDSALPPSGTKIEVLAATAKRDIISHYRQLAAAAGFKLVSLGLRSLSNARCLQFCGITKKNQSVVLVSLRPDEVMIDVIVDQSLAFSRVASLKTQPENDGTDSGADASHPAPPSPPAAPASFAQSVAIQVVRSLHSYTGLAHHTPIAHVVVAGGTGAESDIVQTLSSRLDLPCSLFNPAQLLDIPNLEPGQSAAAISVFGLVLGAHDPEGLPFDFLHPKRPPVQRNLKRFKWIAAAAALFVLLTTAYSIRSHQLTERRQLQQEVREQVRQAESHRPTYLRMQGQTRTVRNWIGESQSWLDHYAYISAILPSSTDVYVRSFASGSGGVIRLSLYARTGEILARLDRDLRAAGYGVRPLAIVPANDRFGYPFQSNVELILPKTLDIDLANLEPPPRPEDDASLDGVRETLTRKP